MEWSVLLCVVVWRRMGAKWGCVENKEEDTVCEFTMREVL